MAGTVARQTATHVVEAMSKAPRVWACNAAFTTTDTTVAITLPAGMQTDRIVAVIPAWASDIAETDGCLECKNTITNGYYVLGTGGTITIDRAAGTTSGAKFCVLVISE